MSVLVVYALCAVAPAAVFLAAAKLLDRWSNPTPRRRGRAVPAVPTDPGLERLVAHLRRLDAEYHRISRSDLPARVSRMRTVTLAYDDTLRACCRALDVPQPERVPLGSVDRLQTEAALAQRGLTW